MHSRVQRWRLGWQRELNSTMAIEVAYSGSYADRQGISIRQDFLPEQYWSSANVRDTSANDYLTANVTNPFYIGTATAPSPFYAALLTSDPLLSSGCWGRRPSRRRPSSATVCCAPFPQMNGLFYNDQPLGVIKSHSLDAILTRRFANGLTGNAAFSINRVDENRTVEEYDREPTLWQTNNNGRPWRVTAAGVYELPFGAGKPFLNNPGMLSAHRGRVDGWRHVRIPAGNPAHVEPPLLLRRPERHHEGESRDRASARRHVRSDEDVVQHRRRVRAGYRRSAGRLPEARRSRSASTGFAGSTCPT